MHGQPCAVEAAEIKVNDVEVDRERKTITLLIRKSKMDQAAKGVKRTLQCCRTSPCVRECPWALGLRILSDHVLADENTPLFPDADGLKVPKVRMVKAWMEEIHEEMSGHSARRSGAMMYTREGLSIYEISTLGRWKSSAVLRYIEEALEEVPLNKTQPLKVKLDDSGQKESHVADEKQPKTKTVTKIQEKMVIPEGVCDFWAISTGRGKAVGHVVRQASWELSLDSWATWCGWHFAQKHVKVKLSLKLGSNAQECKKCKAAKKARDKVKEGMSLAQLVSLTVPPGQQSVAMDGKGNAGKTPEKEEAFGVSAAVKAQRQQPQPTKQK